MEITEFIQNLVALAFMIAPVIALTQVAKMTGLVPKPFEPLMATVIGVLFSVGLSFVLSLDIGVAVIAGILVGLSAGGLYDYKSLGALIKPSS